LVGRVYGVLPLGATPPNEKAWIVLIDHRCPGSGCVEPNLADGGDPQGDGERVLGEGFGVGVVGWIES
jgi:hypothetical protein